MMQCMLYDMDVNGCACKLESCLARIDESVMAEDRSILTTAGKNNSLAAVGEENS